MRGPTPSRSRGGPGIGAIAFFLLLGLFGCGKDRATLGPAEISQTVVYRGVFAHPATPPLLGPHDEPRGTITLSVVEVWGARAPERNGREVGLEATATIDSVAIEVATNGGRSTLAGRFDRSTGVITASGPIPLQGTMTNGRFEGSILGGRFVAITPQTQTVRAYSGTWSGTTSSGDDRGNLSLLIDGARVLGVAANDDGTVDLLEGSYDALGAIVITFPGYRLAGSTTAYAIFGSYESTLDGGRSGTWTTGPCPF